MRVLIACALLAACATAPERAPPDRVAGCWINRYAGPTTMRWTPDTAQGVVNGVKHVSGAANSTAYVLSLEGDHWRLCENRESGAASCWDVAQGEHGSLDGGRAFIDAFGNELRIAIDGDGPERVIFEGRRQNCPA